MPWSVRTREVWWVVPLLTYPKGTYPIYLALSIKIQLDYNLALLRPPAGPVNSGL